MRELTTVAELNELKSQNSKVMVDFHAVWCGPCKAAAPVFQKLSEENPTMAFVKVNVDNAPEIVQAYGVSSMPTFMSFLNGELKETKVGWSSAQLRGMVSNLNK